LLKLGFELAQSTVSKYLPRRSRRSPSQGWRTFLRNQLAEMIAIDFAVVPTVTGQLLLGGPRCGRMPWTTTARYVVRDRDGM